jgi:F-type H+-transporting ATPase subunit epsilon
VKLTHNFALDIVTPERIIFSGQVDAVKTPGIEGEMGILPHHCPLITLLQPGEIAIKQRDEETLIAVGGGFLEVRPDRVIILADIAERDDEVDAARAAKAKRQAQITLQGKQIPEIDKAKAEAALRHALACLRIAEKRKKKHQLGESL